MSKLIQRKAAHGAESVRLYYDWKAVTYQYAFDIL